MPELLLEIFSEEIPSRFQRRAADDLKRLILDSFKSEDLDYESAGTFSTPRRLTLVVSGVAKEIPSKTEERRGPRLGSPQKAVDGFLKSIGQSKEDLIKRNDKNGEFYYGLINRPSRPSKEVISENIIKVMNAFPWEKSMKWGSSNFRWVRPIHSIACILSDQDGSEIVDFSINGVVAGNITYGHRFLCPDPFEITSFDHYYSNLKDAKVILDRKVRSEKILSDASNLAFAHGLELIQDEKLLEEVVGLVEWPVVLLGSIQSHFLELPREILQVSMREHQKFFSLEDPSNGLITSYLAVANNVTSDDCKKILDGNAKVLNARLSDAEFFWQNDVNFIKEHGFLKMGDSLQKVVFHNRLGSQAERVTRITVLSSLIAELIGAERNDAQKAASVCKLDLVSEMVYEFPELQGIMGFYYAKRDGMSDEIANACMNHYSPVGPSDMVPTNLVTISVALADKIDTLTSFWAIEEKPTGSKDPYALRRAAIGIIRILLENQLKVTVEKLFNLVNSDYDFKDLKSFFYERVKVLFKEKGLRSDVLNACYRENEEKTYFELQRKVRLVQEFVTTARGSDLIQGYKRAINILHAEELKDGVEYSLEPNLEMMVTVEEKELFKQLCGVEMKIKKGVEKNNIEKVLIYLASLRVPIDAFFNEVQVNYKSPLVRRNRLCLLNKIKVVMHGVATFSMIDG